MGLLDGADGPTIQEFFKITLTIPNASTDADKRQVPSGHGPHCQRLNFQAEKFGGLRSSQKFVTVLHDVFSDGKGWLWLLVMDA